MSTRTEYIPALGVDWLTPLYDRLLRYVFREETFRRHMVDEAALAPGQRVLDIGCGTGTLAILLRQHYPDAFVYGVDIDRRILSIAGSKARKARASISLQQVCFAAR